MSGEDRRLGAPQGPPWSLDLLADLHAGVLDHETASALRPQVQADPEAREVLAALDATSSDLGDLPALEIPDDVAARIDAALEHEVQSWVGDSQQEVTPAPAAPAETPDSNVVDITSARRRRRRITAMGAGLLTAAAAVLGVVTFTSGPQDSGSNPQAVDAPTTPSSPRPLALYGDQVSLNPSQLRETMRAKQYGPLADPQKLVGCLQANGVNNAKPLGAREITLNGRPGELLILSSGKIGEFRLLTVGPECGPGNPATIANSTFGG